MAAADAVTTLRYFAVTTVRRRGRARCVTTHFVIELRPSAIKEYGRFAAPSTPPAIWPTRTYQRRIGRQLNKGENVHTLKRNIAYANEGALQRRHHEQQTEQMWCLTMVTNSIVSGPPNTTAAPWTLCARRDTRSTMSSSPTSGPLTMRMCTSTARTPSTSTANSPTRHRRLPASQDISRRTRHTAIATQDRLICRSSTITSVTSLPFSSGVTPFNLYSPSGRCSGQSGAVEFLLESWSAAMVLA